MSGRFVFYFVPHQDDEITNFGVSILRDIDAGFRVICVLCTDGGASSARRLIGNGEACHLHAGRHDYPMSREEFSCARDREYIACCREMGIRNEDIMISRFRGRDGELSTTLAEKIIVDAIDGFPPDETEVKTLVPVTETPQNPDHTATGIAARNLFRKKAFAGLSQFYEVIFLNRTEQPQYPLERLVPTAEQAERYCRAADCYGVWKPDRGFYAVGHHSVKDEFDLLTSDPVSLLVKT
ncbi:MAG: PIG-L family deacetylase [Clostridia bacterium]|nr:PIG-L family deacetylase [Clostridia bacterium]